MQRHSLLGGYPGYDALLPIFYEFSKTNPDNYVKTDRTSERFFGRKLDLAKSKGDGLRRARCCCSFKDPSTHTFAATVRRLESIT
jgi:hypothetical protein